MKKRFAIPAVVIGAVIAAGAVFFFLRSSSEHVRWAVVERRSVGDFFEERGWLEATQTTPVRLGAGGEIRELIEDGTTVEPGDVLLKVDTTGLEERLESQEEEVALSEMRQRVNRYRRSRTEQEARRTITITRDRLRLAEMEYAQICEGLTPEDRRTLEIAAEIATIDREDAEEAFFRQSNLVARALASAITLETYERRLAAAAAVEEETRIEFAVRTAPPREDEILDSRLAVERLQGELERGERALERRVARADAVIVEQDARIAEQRLNMQLTLDEINESVVTAPTGGIFRVRQFWEWSARMWQPVRVGVSRGRLDSVADILQPGAMRVVTMIHEADIGGVRTGMTARVRIPALGNLEFTGMLQALGGVGRDRAEVGPPGVEDNQSGVTVFNAAIALDRTDERLRPGMSALISIERQPVAERLLLPREAVGNYEDAARTGTVQTESGDRTVRGEFFDDLWFAVEEGLAEGDRVRVPQGK